jgi:hypothetical protein
MSLFLASFGLALVLRPEGPSSSARFLVIAATAAFRIEPKVLLGWCAASPLMSMMRPQPRAINCGAAVRAQRGVAEHLCLYLNAEVGINEFRE